MTGRRPRGYRYGKWHGGPDPLAPPYDLGNAVDEIGDSVLGGSGVREALRELLRRGTEGRRGLDELRRSVRERLRKARTAGRMDGTLQEVRELLDKALTAEKRELFPDPDDEREIEVLEHLLRQATAQTFRARCAGLDLTGLQEHFTGGETVESGELVPAPALLGQLGTIPKLAELLGRLGVPEGEQSAEQAAAAVEFALEGLYLTRRLAKDTDGARTVYGA